MCKKKLWTKYGCKVHWAKIEVPRSPTAKRELKRELHVQYDLHKARVAKKWLDPHGVLNNKVVDFLSE
jgi:hypothetical protein